MSEVKKEGLKSFNEMMEIDLTQYTQKKPTFYKKDGKLVKTTQDKWLDYIEWGMVLALLYKNGATSVTFNSELDEQKVNTLNIHLSIDSNDYRTQYPLINGNAVIQQPNQLDLHKSELRGFVKCVAIHTGLGLKLWLNEEKSLQDAPQGDKPKEPAKKKKADLKPDGFEKMKTAVSAGNYTVKKAQENYNLTLDQVAELSEIEESKKS
jgi:hypothetical protein